MSKDTKIQWCHSSLNLQMGCDGCELWNGKKRICYAGRQTEGRAGFKGWPAGGFSQPELFLDRLDPALKWGPPTARETEHKPWLNGLPRLIFLNDMGDTFSKRLPEDWLAPLLPRIADSTHHFLLLTKRPTKLAEFAKRHPLPANLWPGTSVTSAETAGRAAIIAKIETGGPKFVSCEPLWSELPPKTFEGLQWAIFGGESGDRDTDVTPTDLYWLLAGATAARTAGAKPFVKQLGSNAFFTVAGGTQRVPFPTVDGHGGEWDEWPMPLRIREMPEMQFQQTLL